MGQASRGTAPPSPSPLQECRRFGRVSSTLSGGRQSAASSCVTTMGRLIKAGWSVLVSRRATSGSSGSSSLSSVQRVSFIRSTARTETPIRATTPAGPSHVGGVFRYAMTRGSMLALRMRSRTLRDVSLLVWHSRDSRRSGRDSLLTAPVQRAPQEPGVGRTVPAYSRLQISLPGGRRSTAQQAEVDATADRLQGAQQTECLCRKRRRRRPPLAAGRSPPAPQEASAALRNKHP